MIKCTKSPASKHFCEVMHFKPGLHIAQPFKLKGYFTSFQTRLKDLLGRKYVI